MCLRSSDPFYLVTYYIKCVNTSWTYSVWMYEQTFHLKPRVTVWIKVNKSKGNKKLIPSLIKTKFMFKINRNNYNYYFLSLTLCLSLPFVPLRLAGRRWWTWCREWRGGERGSRWPGPPPAPGTTSSVNKIFSRIFMVAIRGFANVNNLSCYISSIQLFFRFLFWRLYKVVRYYVKKSMGVHYIYCIYFRW